MEKDTVGRIFLTRRYKDRQTEVYVDEEIPTRTTKIISRTKNGTLLDSSSGETNMGSLYFSGSHHDFGPGTYSYRVTRRSFAVGSHTDYGASAEFALVHSREGTVDQIPVHRGTQYAVRQGQSPSRVEALGAPMAPIYAFGPGTLTAVVTPRHGTLRVYSSIEGLLDTR